MKANNLGQAYGAKLYAKYHPVRNYLFKLKMNSRIFIKTIVILAILWLSLLAYNSIDEWAVWRDIPEDFVDIEDVNREISGKETYAFVLASIPFVGLLVAFIFLLNSIRKDIYRNKKR